jgi:predicted Zn-ribbon and HTH transcriptional regulator
MTNFVCNECGYRFRNEEKPKKCPYCAGESIEKEKSAEELVKSVRVE